MATIEKRKGGYRLVFWYQGERYQGAIKTEDRREAAQLKSRVERNLQFLQEGRLEYRDGDDLFMLMLSDGRLNARPEIAERITIEDFFTRYKDNRPPSKEGNTAYTEDIHIAAPAAADRGENGGPGGPRKAPGVRGRPLPGRREAGGAAEPGHRQERTRHPDEHLEQVGPAKGPRPRSAQHEEPSARQTEGEAAVPDVGADRAEDFPGCFRGVVGFGVPDGCADRRPARPCAGRC